MEAFEDDGWDMKGQGTRYQLLLMKRQEQRMSMKVGREYTAVSRFLRQCKCSECLIAKPHRYPLIISVSSRRVDPACKEMI